MRIAYLGTSAFAAGLLERLAAVGRRVELVVTRPDRPRGRGRRLAAPPVAEAARALGLELVQPEDASADGRLAGAGLDAIVVCAYGARLREPLLSEPGLLNVHPSLLPRWRGAAPIERAIMAGDRETGISIMRPTEGFDEGPVCAARPEPIGAADDYGSLSVRLVEAAARLLGEVLDAPRPFAAQPDEGVTYAEKIAPADRLLDPARSAAELERVVRALHPHIGARLALDGERMLGVRRARALDEAGAPGLHGAGGRLLLGTAAGTLELLEVQPPGGRPMDAGAYLRGRGAG